MRRFIGLIILLAAAIGAHFSLTNVLWQHQANRDWVAVPAQIVDTPHVASHKGSKGSVTYSPQATYTYDYQGRHFQSSRVLALTFSTSSRSWAQGVLARIARTAPNGPEVGGFTTAYVNPQNPEQAILVRDYSFLPYGFGMGTLFAAALGLGLLAGVIAGGRKQMSAIALDESGWHLLLPRLEERKELRNAVLWLIGGSLVILVMPAHWSWVAGQGGVAALVAWMIGLGVIGTLAVLVYRRWSVCHSISDARLRIRPAPARHGQPLALAVDLDARVPLRVTRMIAHILCLEHYRERRGSKTYSGTRTYVERTVELSGVEVLAAGADVDGAGEITLDRDWPPTSDTLVKSYPYYTWEIRLKVELQGMVDYAAVFPLEVA